MKRSKKLGSKLIALMLTLMMVAAYVPMVGDVAYADTITSTVTTDKDNYVKGEPVYVTATSDVSGAWVGIYQETDTPPSQQAYWWYYVNDSYGGFTGVNGETYNIYDTINDANRDGYSDNRGLYAGNYKVLLLDGSYNILASKRVAGGCNLEAGKEDQE